jgi:hypothetical protein
LVDLIGNADAGAPDNVALVAIEQLTQLWVRPCSGYLGSPFFIDPAFFHFNRRLPKRARLWQLQLVLRSHPDFKNKGAGFIAQTEYIRCLFS